MTIPPFELLDRITGWLRLDSDPRAIRETVQRMEREREGEGAVAATMALSSAARDLGIRLTVLPSVGLKEAATMAGPETPVIVAAESGGVTTWVLIRSRKGARVTIGDTEDRLRSISVRSLAKIVGAAAVNAPVVAALVQPQAPLTDMAEEAARHVMMPGANPLPRIFGLFRPEWPEIRVVIAYAMAVGVLSLAAPLAIESMVTTVAFNQVFQPVVILALLLFAALGLAAVMHLLQVYVVEIIQRRLFVRVVADLSHRLPRVKRSAFDSQSGPELVNRFFEVMNVQKICSSILLDGLAIVLSAAVGMIVLAIYNVWLLGFDILLLGALSFSVLLLGRGAISTSVGESRAKYAVAAFIEELARTPGSFRTEDTRQFAIDQADGLTRSYVKFRTRHFSVVWRQYVFAAVVQAAASAGLLGIGGFLVIDGQLTLGQLVAAELIVATVAAAFLKLAKHFDSFYDLMASAEKIGLMLELPLESTRGEFLDPTLGGLKVDVHHAGYHYGESDDHHHDQGHGGHSHQPAPHRAAFAPVSLELKPGERVALCGASGTGKSTLLEVLYGDRIPTEGRLEFDGIDLRELHLESVRRSVALVRPGSIVEGTILDNVRMGRAEICLSDIRKTLAGLGLLVELSELPGGLRTRLLPDGAPLSQRQVWRLLLARALAGRPRLVLVDEGIDRLAPEERERVLDELLDRSQPWTMVLVTESPEAIQRCDRVIRLGAIAHAGHGHGGHDHHGDSHSRSFLDDAPGH